MDAVCDYKAVWCANSPTHKEVIKNSNLANNIDTKLEVRVAAVMKNLPPVLTHIVAHGYSRPYPINRTPKKNDRRNSLLLRFAEDDEEQVDPQPDPPAGSNPEYVFKPVSLGKLALPVDQTTDRLLKRKFEEEEEEEKEPEDEYEPFTSLVSNSNSSESQSILSESNKEGSLQYVSQYDKGLYDNIIVPLIRCFCKTFTYSGDADLLREHELLDINIGSVVAHWKYNTKNAGAFSREYIQNIVDTRQATFKSMDKVIVRGYYWPFVKLFSKLVPGYDECLRNAKANGLLYVLPDQKSERSLTRLANSCVMQTDDSEDAPEVNRTSRRARRT